MIERAIAATEADWRAITAEVTAAELQVALSGMFAMKFMAVRFFPSLQVAALEQLGGADEQLQFIGAVTSAARTTEGWQAWHHWGPAILDWTGEQLDLAQTLCWLHGDSVRVRSMLVAMQDAAQKNLPLPSTIVWTDSAQSIPAELTTISSAENSLQVRFMSDSQRDEHGTLSFIQGLATEGGAINLLFVGDEFPHVADEQLTNGPMNFAQCLVAGGKSCRRVAEVPWLSPSTILSEAEQIVASEVYDFLRWTGQRVDAALLRDAYDEYCDF
jgi:hypothetical protein